MLKVIYISMYVTLFNLTYTMQQDSSVDQKHKLIFQHLACIEQKKPSLRSLLAQTQRENSFAITDARENCVQIYHQNDTHGFRCIKDHSIDPFIITALGISSDGKTVSAGLNDNSLLLFDVDNIETQEHLKDHLLPISAITFNPIREECVTASHDGKICLYQKENKWRLRETLDDHNYGITALAYSPNDRYLATGAEDGKMIVYKKNILNTWDKHQELEEHEKWINALVFNEHSNTLLSGGGDNRIVVWWHRNNTWKPIQTIEEDSIISCIAFISPDHFIRGGYDTKLKLYTKDKKQQWQFTLESTIHKHWIEHVFFWPHYKQLFSMDSDGTIHVWQVDEPKNEAYDNQQHAMLTKEDEK